MKINCYTKELSAAVSRCASAANGQLPITKGVLLEAADGTVKAKQKSPIKIHFAESAALISAQTSIGFASEEVPISLEGTPVTAGYNPKFLLDALKACDTDEVKLRIGGAQSPLVIDSQTFLYMVMPVRLKGD